MVALAARMKRLADGDRTTAIPGLARRDEIGRMAGALDEVAAGGKLAEEARGRSAGPTHRAPSVVSWAMGALCPSSSVRATAMGATSCGGSTR